MKRFYSQVKFLSKDFVVGINKEGSLTKKGKELIKDQSFINKLKWDKEKIRIHYQDDQRFAIVKVDEENKDLLEQFSVPQKVNFIHPIANAVSKLISDQETSKIYIDDFENTKDVSIGAHLGGFKFTKIGKKDQIVEFEHEQPNEEWETGKIYAEAQNLAKRLAETPANYMTPTKFCQEISTLYQDVKIYDKEWAKSKNMGCFLAVAQGSQEEPKIIEGSYMGKPDSKEIDIVLIGKGITFDTGGISLKPGQGMKDMKGDMGGAACVMSTLIAVSKLKLPINIVCISYLTENMPSGNAVKPGDVHIAMNGKTVEIDNTDAEGRLILADALSYGSTYKPKIMCSVATLTGAVVVALGGKSTGAYSTSHYLWNLMEKSSVNMNDLFWRMPLMSSYLETMDSKVADFNNIPSNREAGSPCAAAFLKEFVDLKNVTHYGHLDIAGSMMRKEMTGRPTRSLIEFVSLASKELK